MCVCVFIYTHTHTHGGDPALTTALNFTHLFLHLTFTHTPIKGAPKWKKVQQHSFNWFLIFWWICCGGKFEKMSLKETTQHFLLACVCFPLCCSKIGSLFLQQSFLLQTTTGLTYAIRTLLAMLRILKKNSIFVRERDFEPLFSANVNKKSTILLSEK